MENLIESEKETYTDKFNIIPELFDLSYTPIVQSGGEYDLKPTAMSNNKKLRPDCILLSIGGKYFEYNTNVVRTLFINATKDEEQVYKICFEAHNRLIGMIKPGAVLKELFESTKAFITSKRANLAAHLPSNFGFGIGLEFRESILLINPKNERTVKANMVFNVQVSCKDMTAPNGKRYAVKLVDTVLVKPDGCDVLTGDIDKAYNGIGYNIDDIDDDLPPAPKIDKTAELREHMMNRGDKPLTRASRRGAQKKFEEETFMK